MDVVRTALEQVVQEGSNQLSDVATLPARGYNAILNANTNREYADVNIPVDPLKSQLVQNIADLAGKGINKVAEIASAPLSIPPLTARNIQSVLSGKGITETTTGIQGDLSPIELALMGGLGGSQISRNLATNKILQGQLGPTLAQGLAEQEAIKTAARRASSITVPGQVVEEPLLLGNRGSSLIPKVAAKGIVEGAKVVSKVGEPLLGKPIVPPSAMIDSLIMEYNNTLNKARKIQLKTQIDELQKVGQPTEGKVEQYGMQHRPTEGPPAHDLLAKVEGDDFAPKDIYEHPEWYANNDGSLADRQTISAIKKLRGKPDAEVTIYRSAPNNELNNGDWVSFSKAYAKGEGIHPTDSSKDIPVYSFKVKVSDVKWAGDSLNEFGYFGKEIKLSTPTGEGQKPIDKLRSKMRLNEKGSAMATGPEIRKFIETVKNSVATDPALAAIIDSRYNPKSNKVTMAEADTIIKTDYNLAYAMVMDPAKPSALSNTIAIRLISQTQAVGNWEEAKRLVEMTAERNTAAGQAIQALSMFSKLAPEGITSYVSSVVNRAMLGLTGGKSEAFKNAISGITDDEVKKQIAEKMGVPYVSAKMLEEIYNDALAIQKMPEGREKTVATALMLKKIAMQVPVNLLKKVSMAQTLAQLLNPKTVIRNIFGNFGFAMAEELSMTMATGLDVMASLLTKERTQGLPNIKAQAVGFYKGTKEGLQEALLGIDTRKLNTKFSIPRNGVFNKGVMNVLQKTLAVILQAPDRAFFEAAYMDSLAFQCKINKSNDITPEMIEQAMADGLYKTFQDGSMPAKFLTSLKKAFNLGKDWGMGDMMIKYPATPGNIWARGFEYSPGGFIKSTYHLAQLIRGYEKTHNQREFVRGTARAFTGSALYFGVAAALAGIGLISGKRDPDRDVSALKRQVGMKSYQINISGLKRFIFSGMDPSVAQPQQGDTMISYDWALPISIPMVVGANVMEEAKRRSQKEIPEPGKAITEGIAEAANSMVDQPMLAGLARMRGSDIASWLKETITGIPASFIPTASYQIAKLTDNIVRNTQDPNFFRQAYNTVAARVPGLSKTLPEMLNTFGQPMKSYQGDSNNPFNVFLNPAFVTKYKPDQVSEMVLNIYKQTGEVGHFPRVAPKSVTIEGRTIHLKPDQYHDYQQYIGNKTGVLYTILANDPNFMRMPDELKAQKLANYLGDINTSAKIELFGIYPKKTVQGQRRPYVPKGARNISNLQ